MKKTRFSLKRSGVWNTVALFAIVFGVLLVALSSILIGFTVWADGFEINPDLLPTAQNVSVFLDKDGNRLAYDASPYMSPEETPQNLKNAFIAIEDKRFYEHNGFDTYRIVGAVVGNVKARKVTQGASTITQQLVKNTHLTNEKSLSRKAKELALAAKMEKEYGKDEILSMYLSVIYFGSGAYGVKDASRLFFSKSPSQLTLAECATLAGIVKNPSKYSPMKDENNSLARRNLVLSVMAEESYITYEEYEQAKLEPLTHNDFVKSVNKADFYIKQVIKEACRILNITEYQLNNSGYTIHTNLDTTLQDNLYDLAVSNKLNNVDNSAIVLRNETGEILAHHSTTGYVISRQAGSTLKPIVVYAPAIEENVVTLATPIVDELTTFGEWTPHNYNEVYYGATNPREGIKKSMNTVAVKTASYLGSDKMLDYGRRFGLNLADDDANLALALGSTANGTTPLSVAGAYSAIANGGNHIEPTYIRYVAKDGRKVYENQRIATKVISKDTAFLIADVLRDTVLDGTAKTLSTLPYAVYAKTGTASRNGINTDAWSVSFTSDHTIAVWHGGAVATQTGGGAPTMHAKDVWQSIYVDNFPSEIEIPDEVYSLAVDTYSTVRNKLLTLAVPSTPTKYIKNEYFRASNQLDFGQSAFENQQIDFDIRTENGVVFITVPTEDAYVYQLECTDLLGTKEIASFEGNSSYSLTHRPYALVRQVTYTLRIKIKDAPTDYADTNLATVSKNVYVNPFG